MASLLHRLGRWAADHHWLTIGGWLAIFVIVAASAVSFRQPLTSEFSIPGSRFETVLEDLKTEIPEAAGASGAVVFSSEDGFDDGQRAAVEATMEDWRALDGVSDVIGPFATQEQLDTSGDELDASESELDEGGAQAQAGRVQLEQGQGDLAANRDQLSAEEIEATEAELAATQEQLDATDAELAQGRQQLEDGRTLAGLSEGLRFVSEDGTVALARVTFEDPAGSLDPELTAQIPELGEQLARTGVDVDYSTEIVQDFSSIIGPGEIVGLAIAAVVLLVMLGSLVAAGLPVVMALVGVGVGLMAALATTTWVEMNSTAPVLALMLGLAVGIDYSLFLINRHRTQLRQGMPMRQSIALATGTSGNAVTFAGATVIIALAALSVTGIPFLTVMGLVAAGTVLVAVLVALTLTPAVLSLVGMRVLPRSARAITSGEPHPKHRVEGKGWAAMVMKRPWLAITGIVVLIGVLASPVADLRLGLPDGSSEPADSTAYQTYDQIRDAFGAGVNGPLIVVAELDEPLGENDVTGAQASIGADLGDLDGVTYVVPAGVSPERATLAFQVVPDGGPSEESTVELVNRLDAASTQIGEDNDATIGLTGQTVANIDISAQLADALPIYLAVVIGLSLVLLLLVFRSIVVPLLATAGFLLSLGAAFGTVVAVYQWGYLGGIFGVDEAGPILSFLPILLIGVLFGLAMDYQVFLVSAMREAHVHGESAREAVVSGFNHSARVVVAAAIIMISVFSGFIFAELTLMRPVGLGLAVGVLIDAFVVRMTLTPAVMGLLGERAWYIPAWLDRILPDVDVEGASLERSLGQVEASSPTAHSNAQGSLAEAGTTAARSRADFVA
ncbi:MAG: MMPL family transporter [Ornithinimicrobium sp.]